MSSSRKEGKERIQERRNIIGEREKQGKEDGQGGEKKGMEESNLQNICCFSMCNIY